MVKTVHKYEDETFGTLHDTPAKAIEAERGHIDTTNRSKKIVMDRCRNCPMREVRTSPVSKTHYVCTCPDTDGWEIEHLDLIPTWCPLEDE